jgi:hypothetical protein
MQIIGGLAHSHVACKDAFVEATKPHAQKMSHEEG